MKHKLSSILAAAFLLITTLFSGGAVYAQDEGLPSPGITPDSPLYFFDKLGKNIGMLFTFGSEAKARKALQYAEECLAETQSMASKNKVKEMEHAASEYDKFMAMIQERLEETHREGQSDNISERVALATGKHLEVLARVREQVPEKAKNAIAHAENVSMNGQVNALRVLAGNKPERALDICDNITFRQLEKIRVRATANVTSDNATSANLTALLDYAERIAALEDEMTDIAEASGINITAMQERLAHSTANRLDVLSGVYEKAPVQAQSAIANAIENSVMKYERTVEKLEDKNIASVNETISILPEQLKERIQASISNRVQVATSNSGNETQLRVTTETQEQSRERLENKETPKPVTATANQTREQKETGKQDNNTQNKP